MHFSRYHIQACIYVTLELQKYQKDDAKDCKDADVLDKFLCLRPFHATLTPRLCRLALRLARESCDDDVADAAVSDGQEVLRYHQQPEIVIKRSQLKLISVSH